MLAFGAVEVYAQRGEYQLVVELLEPRGLGALQLAFEQLKAAAARRGALRRRRASAPLPRFPRKIGIVTSPSGAALRDMLRVIGRRFGEIHIVMAPARVQGDGAAAEIAQGIRELNALGDVDVIIVGRGGGSLEDLWAFNEEMLARTIAASKVPVISAVGHEVDFTIADFVADVRAPTPSSGRRAGRAGEAGRRREPGRSDRPAASRDRAARSSGHRDRLERARGPARADRPRPPAARPRRAGSTTPRARLRQAALAAIAPRRRTASRWPTRGLRGAEPGGAHAERPPRARPTCTVASRAALRQRARPRRATASARPPAGSTRCRRWRCSAADTA